MCIRDSWHDIAARSREAALHYVGNLSAEPFERLLLDVLQRPKAFSATPPASDARKRLAALRLKQRRAPSWFPTIQTPAAGVRLFCFPHAGGGTRIYRSWSIAGVEVCPVLLPGRENRASESAIDNMPELIDALATAIRPYVNEPYAFFGHSMGAGIAFELARRLDPLPKILIVSAARGPQYRTNLQPRPDPSDEELLEQLSTLGGDRETLEIALPLLRADTRLYRNYRFESGPPLTIPIAAYGGASDPNVRPEDLALWSELTQAAFHQRQFEGGHFYLETASAAVVQSLKEDMPACS